MQKIEAGKLNVLAITLERLKVALKCNWDDLMNDSLQPSPLLRSVRIAGCCPEIVSVGIERDVVIADTAHVVGEVL